MKPEPVPQSVVCTACGLPWPDHKPTRGKVTLSECVRLLTAELARRPVMTWTNNVTSGLGNVYAADFTTGSTAQTG